MYQAQCLFTSDNALESLISMCLSHLFKQNLIDGFVKLVLNKFDENVFPDK